MRNLKVFSTLFSIGIHILLLFLWLPVKESKPPVEVKNEFNFINAVVVSQPEIETSSVKNVEPPKVEKQPELIQNEVKDVKPQEIMATEENLISPIEDLDQIDTPEDLVPKIDKEVSEIVDANKSKTYIPFYKVDKRPKFYKKGELIYPEIAKRNRVEGKVILEVDIDEFGNVKHCKVIRKIGFGLETAAIDMIYHSSFTPAYSKNKPVPVRMRFTVNFQLD